ncbi:MAG: hypothetical protein HGA19_23080, partial [Oscillochloris sp.]|nr:hypothetical protein [Oscillochloris sp.]
DVHVVVSGRQVASSGQRTSPTTIDVRVRCLYDPRSSQISESAKKIHDEIRDQLLKTLQRYEAGGYG